MKKEILQNKLLFIVAISIIAAVGPESWTT